MAEHTIRATRGLRNALAVFGLVLVAGDGPLVVAYGLTSDPARAWVLLLLLGLFTFGMAGFFCYLVAAKPRHLFAPDQIPEWALGRSIFHDPKSDIRVEQVRAEAEVRAEDRIKQVRSELKQEVESITAKTNQSVNDLRKQISGLLDKAVREGRTAEKKVREDSFIAQAIKHTVDYVKDFLMEYNMAEVRLSERHIMTVLKTLGADTHLWPVVGDKLVRQGKAFGPPEGPWRFTKDSVKDGS